MKNFLSREQLNGSKFLRREIHPAISLPARENGQALPGAIIDFVSSDETLDRYGEIIVASGWQLENYRKNPVVLNAHNYGDILFTIGRALITEVRGPALFQRIEFATDINPVARIAYGLYRGKFLNAVSVGFIPLRWETGSPDAGFIRKYLEQELVEVSAVGIPANPNALQLALQEGAIEKTDLRELVEHLEAVLGSTWNSPGADRSLAEFCHQQADPRADTGALGPGVEGAPWEQCTQLLNQIRAVLRRA